MSERKENNVALGEIQFHGRPLPPSAPRRPVTPADLAAFPSPFAHDSVGVMSEYVPDDDEVRAVWRDAMTETSEYFDALSPAEADRRFNAWLQTHDARIASEAAESALREAADDLRIESENAEPEKPSAYREGVAAGLLQAEDIVRTRADSIRAEREAER